MRASASRNGEDSHGHKSKDIHVGLMKTKVHLNQNIYSI